MHSTADNPCHFFQSLLVIDNSLPMFVIHTQTIKCVVALPVSQWQTHLTFYKNGCLKMGTHQQRFKHNREMTSDNAGVKFKLNKSGESEL